jgi:hypothetical protein
MKQKVKLFKSALCGKVTIVVSVAVPDVATSYKHTQFKHASLKLQNSTHLIRISQHFRHLSCPALASEGCRFVWKLCTGDKIMYFLLQIHYGPILFKAQLKKKF